MRGNHHHHHYANKKSSHWISTSNLFVIFIIIVWIASFTYFLSIQKHTKLIFNQVPTKLTKPSADNANTQPASTSSIITNINYDNNKNIPSTISFQHNEPDNDNVHIVFSTDCRFFQDWQSLLLFHSAMQIDQKGEITRIASGCDEKKKEELTTLYKKLFPNYHVHFTPDFKTDPKTKAKYDFYNKPYGLQHWLKYANPPVKENAVVILIDPDMILLRPITLELANNPSVLYIDDFDPKKENVPKYIGKHHPAAQIYGLGAPWTLEDRKHFNRTAVCGVGSPCLEVDRKYGETYFRLVSISYLLYLFMF
jgi:hypothetical protein